MKRLKEPEVIITKDDYVNLTKNIPGLVYRSYLHNGNRMEFFNDKLKEITGYSEKELIIGSVCNIDPLIIPEDRAKVIDAINNAVKAHESYAVDYRIRCKDKSIVWVIERGLPVYDLKGTPLYIDGVIFDITKEKLLLEKISSNASLLNSTIESTADGILVIDLKGKVSLYNKRFLDLWNIPKKLALLGDDKKLLDYVLNKLVDSKGFISKVNYLYSHPLESSFDTFYFKDGKVFERYSIPQKKNGEVIGRVWSFRDVTTKKKFENDLISNDKLLNSTFSAISDLIFVFDSNAKFILYNAPKNYPLYSKPEFFIGKKFSEVMPSYLVSKFNEAFSKARNGLISEFEYSLDFNGYINNFHAKLSPIIINNKFNGAVAVVRDITERKKMEVSINERLKELKIIYDTSTILEKYDTKEALQEIVELIPKAFMYPELTCARIVYASFDFKSRDFKKTKWGISVPIKISSRNTGFIQVYYKENKSFLKEEEFMLNEIANQIGNITERINFENQTEHASRFPKENPSPVIRVDTQCKVLFSNKAGIKFMNSVKKKEGSLEKCPISKEIKLALTNNTRRVVEYIDDTIYEITIVPFPKLGYANLYASDITERKLFENSLIESEARFKEIILQNPYPIEVHDSKGMTVLVNKAHLALFGLASEELIVGKYNVLKDPIVKELGVLSKVRNAYKGKTVFLPEVIMPLRKVKELYSGSKINESILEATIFPVKRKGKIWRVVTIWHDITERKLFENSLKHSELVQSVLLDVYKKEPDFSEKELYNYVLDKIVELTNSTIGFFHVVSDDQKNIILTSWNAEARRTCGAKGYETHYPLSKAGNWADCVRQKKAVVYNDFPQSPNQKGIPKGHVNLTRFMSIPVIEQGKVKFIFGVGNKSKPYDTNDVKSIELVAKTLGELLKQRYTNQELKQSESKFMTAFNSSPNLMAISELETGIYIDVNKSFSRILGYSQNEVIGKSSKSLDIFADYNERTKATKTIKEKGFVKNILIKIKAKSGSVKNVLFSGTIIKINKKPCLLTIGSDVTEMQKAENKLRESERIVNHALDMLCIAGFDGYFKVLNPSFSRTLGWSNEELLSKPWNSFVHPDDRKATENIKSSLINGVQVYQFENRYLCKDGSIKWLSWNSYPYPKEGIMYGVARDVTEIKKAENKLRESEEKYRNLIENTNDIAYSMNNNGVITYLGPQAKKYGINPKSIVGKSFISIVYQDDILKVLSDFKKTYKTGKEFPTVFRVKDVNGNLYWLEEFGKLIKDSKGKLIGTQGVLRDITERKKAEDALQNNVKELNLLSNALTEMVALPSNEDFIDLITKKISEIVPDANIISSPYDKKTNKITIKSVILRRNPNFFEKSAMKFLIGKSLPLQYGKVNSSKSYVLNKLSPNDLRRFTKGLKLLQVTKFGKLLPNLYQIYLYVSNKLSIIITIHHSKELANTKLIEAFANIISLALERRKSIDSLKSSEETFRNIFDNATDGMVIIGLDSKIININKRITELSGYSSDELIGKSFFSLNFISANNLLRAGKIFANFLVNPKSFTGIEELEVTSKNGEKLVVEYKGFPFIKDNKMHGAVVIMRDVTEKRKHDRLISLERDKLKNYMDIAEAIIVGLDINGNISFINRKGCDILNYPENKIIGKNWFNNFLPKESVNTVNEEFKKLISLTEIPDEMRSYENSIINSRGFERIISWSNALIKDDKGNNIGTISYGDDITDKRAKENELNKLREEDSINRARKDFLMLVTHELKQPLTPIMGYADILKEGTVDVEKLKYLDRIINGAQEMYDLINRIISLMRIETGQINFTFKEINSEQLINESLSKRASMINLKNIKIEKDVKNFEFIGDYNLLRDVIVNLIDNAIKFSSNESIIQVKIEKKDNNAVFSVKDNGIGIHKEDMPMLFKTFSQTIEGKKQGGFGIGLSLCKMIVDNHKGSIIVKSAPGKGSIFIVKIPMNLK